MFLVAAVLAVVILLRLFLLLLLLLAVDLLLVIVDITILFFLLFTDGVFGCLSRYGQCQAILNSCFGKALGYIAADEKKCLHAPAAIQTEAHKHSRKAVAC